MVFWSRNSTYDLYELIGRWPANIVPSRIVVIVNLLLYTYIYLSLELDKVSIK